MMAGILKYFHHTNNSSRKNSHASLPDPNGELSKTIPSSSITATNTMVNEILEKPRGKYGEYLAITSAQKFSVRYPWTIWFVQKARDPLSNFHMYNKCGPRDEKRDAEYAAMVSWIN